MIKLCVEDYCHNCPMFKAKTKSRTTDCAVGVYFDTVITCEDSERCNVLVAYLLDKLTKERTGNAESSDVSGTVRG